MSDRPWAAALLYDGFVIVVADTDDDRLVSLAVQPDGTARGTGQELRLGSPACVLSV